MDVTLESRIRNRAYAIWEAEGHPVGEELRHWEMARIEVLSAEKTPKGARSARSAATTPTVDVPTATVKAKAVKKTAAPEKAPADKAAKPAKSSRQAKADA